MHLRRTTGRSLLGLAILCGALTARSDGANWSRFRGPNGTGIADDKNIPVEWQTDSVLWKVAIPGKGHSSPVVWGDNVFLQSSSKDGTERWLFCLSATTGKTLWKQTVQGTKAVTHLLSSYASSTPAVDGERVYTTFWDGKRLSLDAYDLKGAPLWQRDLGEFRSQHGAGHSPMVFDGKVFFADDQDDSATLFAFDAKTGEPSWKVERPAFRACYSTPFVLERPNEPPQLIVTSTAGITAYNPKDGKVLWNYTWSFTKMPLRTVASSIVADGHIIAGSGDGSLERNQIAVRLGGSGDVSKTHLAWETRVLEDSPYVPCSLASGPYVFSVNDFGLAACHVAKTGEKVWSHAFIERRRGDRNARVTASPVMIDGKIYAIDIDGKVYVFEAGPKFKLLATNNVGEKVEATPAVADGRLFIRGEEHLFCIGKPTTK
jgi:outer membrane protein assembly factor BamB